MLTAPCSGNFLVVASSASVVVALTWGGVKFAWSSVHVLVPLIVGLVGLGLFLIYEATYSKDPLVRRPHPRCNHPLNHSVLGPFHADFESHELERVRLSFTHENNSSQCIGTCRRS